MGSAEQLPHSIVLIGFMGCGKSTVGRELKHSLGYPLVDTDHLIVERAGKPIPEIFAECGEPGFREIETAVLRDLCTEQPVKRIIATGGGIVLSDENRELLRELGCVVWLHAPAHTIFRRTSRNRDRPLLQTENPRELITTMLAERAPFYRGAAHIDIDTDGLSSNEVACGILESVRYFFSGHREE